jgi:hypothetical protein
MIPVGTPRSAPQWGHSGAFDSFEERRVVSLICDSRGGPKLYRMFTEESISAWFYTELQIRGAPNHFIVASAISYLERRFKELKNHRNAYPIRAYTDRPFIPNGECRGNVSIPLNELTVELRSGNTLKRFCAPIASL